MNSCLFTGSLNGVVFIRFSDGHKNRIRIDALRIEMEGDSKRGKVPVENRIPNESPPFVPLPTILMFLREGCLLFLVR